MDYEETNKITMATIVHIIHTYLSISYVNKFIGTSGTHTNWLS